MAEEDAIRDDFQKAWARLVVLNRVRPIEARAIARGMMPQIALMAGYNFSLEVQNHDTQQEKS